MRAAPSAAAIRRRLYEILEHGPRGGPASQLASAFLVLLILVNIATVTLETVPDLEARYHALFAGIEMVSLVVFTLEYVLRLYVACEHEPYKHLRPFQARWRYARSAAGIVDLVSVLPFWFAFVLPDELRAILVFRVFRFVKLARYSPGMRSLIDALYEERRALGGCVLILAGATVIAGTLMYMIERHVQPDKLGTIPDAMWWAVVTLGTIGYGDVVPVTGLGKILAALTVMVGLAMIALPVGIVATAFSEQIHRRDFIVTWGMVARVPLFAGLTAAEIADVMRLLRAETVEAGAIVTRRGDRAHSMYFIARGEVEFDRDGETKRLGVGHFFGEIAALRQARRSATIRARQRTSLLVLDARDLRALMDRQPRIAERLREAVRDRLGHDLITPAGDIVTEELEDDETGAAGRKPKRDR
jgi:voltage-gated potassium channel